MSEPHKIFLGYDPSQQIAYDVLKYSLEKHATAARKVAAAALEGKLDTDQTAELSETIAQVERLLRRRRYGRGR